MDKFDLELDYFMISCDSKNLSRKTLANYEQNLRLFQLYLKTEHEITEATKVKSWHIQSYISHLREREVHSSGG